MKKIIAVWMAALMLLAMAACTVKKDNQDQGHTSDQKLPNSFEDVASLEDAEKAAGFTFRAPDTLNGSDNVVYRVLTEGDKMIEIIYLKGEEEVARIRKAPGSEDISGDYNEYAETTVAERSGISVKLKGKDGKVMTASWNLDGYSYSLTNDSGMEAEEILSAAAAMTESESSAQIPNPFTDHATLEDAEKAAGFDIKIPESAAGSDSVVYRSMSQDMLEIIYYKGDEEALRVRKAPGSEDISGVNMLFLASEEAQAGEQTVTLKGNEETTQLAIWTANGYTYSVFTDKGLSQADMLAIAAAIQ